MIKFGRQGDHSKSYTDDKQSLKGRVKFLGPHSYFRNGWS